MPRKRTLPAPPSSHLPRLSKALVAAMQEFSATQTPTKRPPVYTGAFLALLVELHRRGLPIPTRAEIAAHIGCKVDNVDRLRDVGLVRDWFTVKVAFIEGNVQQRDSSITLRYFVPSRRLMAAADDVGSNPGYRAVA